MRLNGIKKISLFLLICYAIFIVLVSISFYIFPLPINDLEKDYSTVHLASNNELLRITLSPSQKYRIKLKLDDISEYLKNGFLFYEDRFFFYHYGVNPIAIMRALLINVQNKKIISGASTITMQIAKMSEPRPRTLKSKIIEIFRAIQLERKYSKKELLEIYLNIVPMGGNIEGVGAASYLYFGKPAKNLTLGESAILVALPKSPNIYRPDIYPQNAKKQRRKVLSRIGNKLEKSQDIVQKAMEENIPEKRFNNPYQIPNLLIRTESMGSKFFKRYTINMALQRYCENVIRKTIKKLKNNGCYNGAMILINNKTMEVLAYVGSSDFNDSKHGGQINCANIKRSPGSALKPFLYSMGVEKGMITPQKILFDIERNYDGYNPINFDKKFIGPVTAEEAIINSLNVPAVNLEYELGHSGLVEFLRKAHIIDEKKQLKETGLSLVLGAFPLTLEELVRLYACLANGGKLRELKFLEEARYKNEGHQILSQETCYIISTMLSKVERTDLPQSWEFSPTRGKIAFKTGTSFGLKDAWCIGYNPDYTVGVWLGNVNCKGSSVLVGIKVAAPIVVETFNYLTRYKDSWFKKPENVKERKVCAVSGEVAGPYCKKTTTDFYIPGVSNNQTCSVHHQIYIRKSDGAEACRYCMNSSPEKYSSKIVEIWPPDVASYLRNVNKKVETIPKHNPDCNAIETRKGLKIKSPMPNGCYVITSVLPVKTQKIMLKVQSDVSCEVVYWFVDDRLIAQGSSDKEFYIAPVEGDHTVVVMNTRGQFDSVKLKVKKDI